MPVLLRSHTDLKAAMLKPVKGLVHHAASQCLSDQEFAAFVQLALERYSGAGGRWCVLAGRGTLVYRCRSHKGTRALFRVPCLAVDLAKDGSAPPGLTLSCLIFQPMDDDRVPTVQLGPSLTIPSVLPVAEQPAAAEQPELQPAPQPQLLPPAEVPRAALAPLLQADTPSPSACASPDGAAHLCSIVGGVLQTLGLHPGVDADFCAALKEALTLEYGNGTWHVFLGQALPGAAASSSAAAAAATTPPSRKYTAAELLGHAASSPSAHQAAVAPPCFVPGSFMELQLDPRQCRQPSNPASPASTTTSLSAQPLSPGPRRYNLMLFQTSRAAREAAGLPGSGQLHSAWTEQPLVVLRVLLNAAGFAAFVGYVALTHGQSNACSRLKGSTPAAAAAAAGTAAEPTSFFSLDALDAVLQPFLQLLGRSTHVLGLFSGTPGVAEASLGLPVLSALDFPPTAPCSMQEVLAADLRIARGRVCIFATLCLLILSVVVVKPVQKLQDSSRARGAATAITRQSAAEAAQRVRGGKSKVE